MSSKEASANRGTKFLTQADLYEILPFGKTKIKQLIKAGVLPLVKVGKQYVTSLKGNHKRNRYKSENDTSYFATYFWLLSYQKKVGVEVVSKLMGHATITITLNNYIHTIQEEEVKAMNTVSIC